MKQTTTEQRCLDAVERFEEGVMRAARTGAKNVETSVSEALDRAFDLAEQVLARQRELVHDLAKELAATFQGAGEPESQPSPGPRAVPAPPKSGARRAPAKRAPAKRATG
jgi:hypothetical protein